MRPNDSNVRVDSGELGYSSNDYGRVKAGRRQEDTMMIMIDADQRKRPAADSEQQADTPSLPQTKNFPETTQSAVSTKQSIMAKVLARNPSASSRLRTQTNPNDSNDYDTVDLMRSKLRGQRSATPGDSQSSERIMNYYLKQADERGIPQRLPFTDESAADEERLLQVIESNLGDVSMHVQEEYQGKLAESREHEELQDGYASFNPLGRNYFAPKRDGMPTRHLAPVGNRDQHDYPVRMEGSQPVRDPPSRPQLADSLDFQRHDRRQLNSQEQTGARYQVPVLTSADKRIGAAGYTPSQYVGPSRMSQTSLQPPGDEGYSYMQQEIHTNYQMDRAARQESARANLVGVEDAEEENRHGDEEYFRAKSSLHHQNLPSNLRIPQQHPTPSAYNPQDDDYSQENHQNPDHHIEEHNMHEEQAGPKHFEMRMLEMYHEWYQEDFERSVLSKQDQAYDPVNHLLGHIRSPVPKNRVGALTQVYKLVYTSALENLDRIKQLVGELGQLVISRRDCVYSLCLSLEIIYFVGPVFSWMKQPAFVQTLGELAGYYECEEVQRKSIRVLFGLGTEGIKELIRVCSLSVELEKMTCLLLINEPAVIETIIVPALLNQFHNSDTKQQAKTVSALGKLGTLCSRSTEAINLLSELLQSNHVDRTLVVSALRAMGPVGEAALCRVFKNKGRNNPKLRASICFFLGQKVPQEFADHIEITLDDK